MSMSNMHHFGGNGVERVPQRTTRTECAALPKGWIREEVPRRHDNMNNSNSTGINSNYGGPKSDIYYISPMGKRIRSRPELLKYLGDTMDLTNFEYRSGKMCHPQNNRKVQSSSGNMNRSASTSISGKTSNGRPQGSSSSGHGSNRDSNSYDLARGLRADASLVPPIRQTASIFKQPVTVRTYLEIIRYLN